MLYCDACGQSEATVFVTKISHSYAEQRKLCASCSRREAKDDGVMANLHFDKMPLDEIARNLLESAEETPSDDAQDDDFQDPFAPPELMLVEQGHRRLAFLPGPTDNLGAEERLRGFRRGMAEAGLPIPNLGNGPRDYTDVTGYARTKALMTGANPPTALLAAGDLLAAGALKALREMELDVPGDVSVVGFGDFHLASLLQPTLTTVRLPLAELGEEAASLLHRQIEGNSRQKTPLLPTRLVMRESVGPPCD